MFLKFLSYPRFELTFDPLAITLRLKLLTMTIAEHLQLIQIVDMTSV